MPEGPVLVIMRDKMARFVGQEIVRAEGVKLPFDGARLVGQRIGALRTWGKHFLIQTPAMVVRIHLLMFGSYCIDERKDKPVKLSLGFADGGEINFYSCSVKEIDPDIEAHYDWSADVMSDAWNPAAARKKLRAAPDTLVCDALLDQQVFSGVGNIIKNEVLFRIRLHPLSTVGALPPARLRALVEEARNYSFDFLEWRQAGTLRRHWLAHNQKTCPRCQIPFHKDYLGITERRSFWCERCQKRYA